MSFFSPSEDIDYALFGYLIEEKLVKDATTCYQFCLTFGVTCQSFNVEYNMSRDDNKPIACELNSSQKGNVPRRFFRKKKNYIYHEMIVMFPVLVSLEMNDDSWVFFAFEGIVWE